MHGKAVAKGRLQHFVPKNRLDIRDATNKESLQAGSLTH